VWGEGGRQGSRIRGGENSGSSRRKAASGVWMHARQPSAWACRKYSSQPDGRDPVRCAMTLSCTNVPHCTAHLGPAVALDAELVVAAASLQHGLLCAAATRHLANSRAAVAAHHLRTAERGEDAVRNRQQVRRPQPRSNSWAEPAEKQFPSRRQPESMLAGRTSTSACSRMPSGC
jgi:hypothetical protein